MSIAYGFWPIREEMSTSTRKGIKHVHRNLKQHQGPSCWQQPHECEKNTCQPLRTSLSGQECGWSLANGCCLMIWVLTEGGRGGRFWWTVPALRWFWVSSCQVSWGNPSVPFVTSFYHSVILTRSLSTLFQWIETSCSRDDFKHSLAVFPTCETSRNQQHSSICNIYDNELISFIYSVYKSMRPIDQKKGGQMITIKYVSWNVKIFPEWNLSSNYSEMPSFISDWQR